jgi:hypothetical protein
MCRPLTEAEISAIVEAGGGRYIGVLGEIPEKTESITDQRDCGDSGAAHVAEGLSGKAAIILAERGASQPEAVVAWTYPGLHCLSGLSGQRISFTDGMRTRLTSGDQSPLAPSASTGHIAGRTRRRRN